MLPFRLLGNLFSEGKGRGGQHHWSRNEWKFGATQREFGSLEAGTSCSAWGFPTGIIKTDKNLVFVPKAAAKTPGNALWHFCSPDNSEELKVSRGFLVPLGCLPSSWHDPGAFRKRFIYLFG